MLTILTLAVLLVGLLLRLFQGEIPPEAMPFLLLLMQLAPPVLAVIGITGGLKGLFDRVDSLPGLHGIGALVASGVVSILVLIGFVAVGWWPKPEDAVSWNATWMLFLTLATWFREQAGLKNLGGPKSAIPVAMVPASSPAAEAAVASTKPA